MSVLTSVQELLPLLGSVATADDPIAALEQRGHQLQPALKARLRTRRTPSPAQRRLWNKAAAKAGTLHYTVGQDPRIARRALAPGEFEFSAGMKMSVGNEILAGLHANGVIPNTLFLDELLSPEIRTALSGGFVVDRPGGSIGRFLITAPPTVAPIRDGLDRVAFTIPFRLSFERITTVFTGSIRTVVTFATGRLRLSVGVVADPPPGVGPRNLDIQIDLSKSEDARLEVDANSPVQLKSPPAPGQPDGFAIILQNALQQQLASTLRFSISTAIPLPIGKLGIHKIVVVTRGDALLVGVKVDGTGGTGDPATLTALFPNPQTNFFSRVHDEVLRLIVQSAARSGELTRIAKGTHPDAVVDSADVAFGEKTIKVITKGKIVDLCPLGVDVGFTVTTTVTVTMEGTRIRIDRETSNDLDNLDAFLCVLTSLGLALLAAISVIVFQGLSLASGFAAGAAFGVVGALTLLLEFDGDDLALVLSGSGGGGPTFVDLNTPIPSTDLLPTLTGAFIRLDESTMLIAAHLGTRPDDVNTYFYVRFLAANELGIARALKGASVRLMDRDSPQPAGDDVTFPRPSTTTTGHNTPLGPVSITKETRFERTADETFGQATTDFAGRVRFYVPRGKLASKAGNKVVKTTRLNLETDRETSGTVRTAIREPNPDFYFKVIKPDGAAVDTLTLSSGFFLNFQSRRIGTPANPLSISFGGGVIGGGGGVVVFDPEAG